MKKMLILLFAFTLTLNLFATEENLPMTLDVMEIKIKSSLDEKSSEELILAIRIRNHTDTLFFVPESGFNIILDIDEEKHVFEYMIPNIKIQGLPVSPNGSLELGNIICGKSDFTIDKGFVTVSYQICPDTDLSSLDKEKNFYFDEIKSQKYNFELIVSPDAADSFKYFFLKPSQNEQ